MSRLTRCWVLLAACLVVSNCTAGTKAGKQNNRYGFKHPPKNVIVFIGDGMGFNHVNAASIYEYGQLGAQPFEDFPVRLAMSTYSVGGSYNAAIAWATFDYVKSSPTDSAAAATAMATGVKSYNEAIGVNVNRNPVPNLVEKAESLGKATGVVTSVPFCHATPAGFVAHNTNRNNFHQIAAEMISASAVDVIMGCGHPLYDNSGKSRTPANTTYLSQDVWTKLGKKTPCADADGDGTADPWTLVQTRQEFQNLMTGPAPARVVGVPQVYETLQEYRSGNASVPPYQVPVTQTVPTLEEMARGAINVLDEDQDGFFLMIEGGAIDWAAHSGRSGRVIEEEIGFYNAIAAVLDWVEENSNWGETLVIITADHETGYLTGSRSGQTPTGPVWNPLVNNGDSNLPGMQWNWGGHTNSLVPFFAKGRGAHLFKEIAVNHDPIFGEYINNTDIAKVVFALWADD